tara:strand:+ start:853 stop:1581 length:729 start_codon:yes stop_codon:yes gene_type:complete
MVTFGSKISTEGGITGKGGTIATKEARKKDEAKKKDKELANLPQYEKELPPKQNIFSKITKGIGSLIPSGGGGGDRNVTIPNQDKYGQEFTIDGIKGFTLNKGPFGLGTSLYGPKHKLPEFLQQDEGALLQSALNAQRYGDGNISVGDFDNQGNRIGGVITLDDYNPPSTAQEFIDNIYQNPNNMVEGIIMDNPYFNIVRGLGYAGVDKNSGLFNTGVASALRNRGNEGFFRNVQSLMSGEK